MTKKEAEKIINQYSAVFARGPGIRLPISLLPCSKARVKYAFFVWVESLIDQRKLTQDLATKIEVSYDLLSRFVDDSEAEKVNELSKMSERNDLDWASDEATILKTALIVDAAGNLSTEMNAFMAECYARRTKP